MEVNEKEVEKSKNKKKKEKSCLKIIKFFLKLVCHWLINSHFSVLNSSKNILKKQFGISAPSVKPN